MLLATGFATVTQIVYHCQIPYCVIKYCYSWVKKCDFRRLRHKYYWYVEMLVTSSIIPYLNILYPHMGPPTTPWSQAPPSKSGPASNIYFILNCPSNRNNECSSMLNRKCNRRSFRECNASTNTFNFQKRCHWNSYFQVVFSGISGILWTFS